MGAEARIDLAEQAAQLKARTTAGRTDFQRGADMGVILLW
jgi:hypothetical protein